VYVARGGVRVGRLLLRRQGQPQRVAGAGGVAGGVQPLADLGHLRLLRQRPQHHRSRLAGPSGSSSPSTISECSGSAGLVSDAQVRVSTRQFWLLYQPN
jgi:hypothetical protein